MRRKDGWSVRGSLNSINFQTAEAAAETNKHTVKVKFCTRRILFFLLPPLWVGAITWGAVLTYTTWVDSLGLECIFQDAICSTTNNQPASSQWRRGGHLLLAFYRPTCLRWEDSLTTLSSRPRNTPTPPKKKHRLNEAPDTNSPAP